MLLGGRAPSGTDMGDGDAWPEIRDTILGCDILVLAFARA